MNYQKVLCVSVISLLVICSLPVMLSENVTNLQAVSGYWKQSTAADFNAGTFTDGNMTVSGASSNASIVLKTDPVWKELTSPQSLPRPQGHLYHGLSFDTNANVMVLFGGSSSVTFANDTWIYTGHGNRWTSLPTINGPLGRYGHSMVYVPSIGATVLFGGFWIKNNAPLNDTWYYYTAKNLWVNMTQVHSPSARGYYAMVYDNYTNNIVVFGGTTAPGGYDFNDTWLYNPSTHKWTSAIPSNPNPPGRSELSMAYDGRMRYTVMYGGLNRTFGQMSDSWSFDGTSWAVIDSSVAPPSRYEYGMAYDPGTSKVIIFGGNNGTKPMNDLYWYNESGRIWAYGPSTPPTPLPIQNFKMVYDSSRSLILLYGGMINGYMENMDVWSLNTTDWRWNDDSIRSLGGPNIILKRPVTKSLVCVGSDGVSSYDQTNDIWTKLYNYSLVDSASAIYSPIRDQVILFGGLQSTYFYNNTYAFNFTSKSWSVLLSATGPGKRRNFTMVYDDLHNSAILFGGLSDTGNMLVDTWQFKLSSVSWGQVNTGTNIPPPRKDYSMVYIPGSVKIYMFGGQALSGLMNDTWVFDTTKNTWTQVATINAPTNRSGAAMSYDPTFNRILLFGGKTSLTSNLFTNDLWAFNLTSSKWSLVSSGVQIPPRWKATMTYCDWNHELILAHGNNNLPFNDIWASPAYRTKGSFMSSKWDTGMSLYSSPTNPGLDYQKIWWNNTGSSAFGAICIQLRSASTQAGLNSSIWYGPTSDSDYYTVPGTDINPIHKDAAARWLQYRLIFNTSNPAETPQLKDITITYQGDLVVPELHALLIPIVVLAILFILIQKYKKKGK